MPIRLWPLERGTFTLTSGFGPRWGRHHSGLDLGAPDGTPFYACQAGTVLYIGPATGYGQWIVVDSTDAEGSGCVEYGHMWNAYATGLKAGDHVDAGQLLGYVGSNGESTGPHLHITVWERGYNGRRIDPEEWLAGAAYPNERQEPKPMTLYGVDVSNHQPNFDFGAAEREGFTFATHKITEGDSYRDPYWPRALEQMREHFPGRFGGYHFWRRGNPDRQADLLLDHVGDPSVPIQLDFEDTDAARDVTAAEMFAMIRAIEARGMRVFANYLPRWYWQQWMRSANLLGSPPIWNSDYGAHRAGYASAIYPGDNDSGWAPFGAEPVRIFQFSERGVVAGMNTVDVNAFRGTLTELEALFSGGDDQAWEAIAKAVGL